MDKILEALKAILPESEVDGVVSALQETLTRHEAELEAEYQEKLDEAYEEMQQERAADQRIANEGYEEAHGIIKALTRQVEDVRAAGDEALKEGFEEAYQELQKVIEEKKAIEAEVYEDADRRLKQMQEHTVTHVTEFLAQKERELYEDARREVLSDPQLVEARVAIERIAETVGPLTGGGFGGPTTRQIEEARREADSLRTQLRITEAKNLRITSQNERLNEQVRAKDQAITESARAERTERKNRSGKGVGRGKTTLGESVVIETLAEDTGGRQDTLKEGVSDAELLLDVAGVPSKS